MKSSPFDASSVLSFNHMLIEVISEFLDVRQMSSKYTAEALSELVVSLATYKEEGLPLFPQVFLFADTNDIITLKGFDMRRISEGVRNRDTMRRALKQCAPLCRGGWSIYFDLSEENLFIYGLFRTDSSVLASTPMERLRATTEPRCQILGISRLAENVVELSASAGYRRFIHLSGARTDVPHPTEVIENLVHAITHDVKIPPDAFWEASVSTFFRHVFYDVMQAPYGCLAMVVPAGESAPCSELLADGVMLAPQIDVVSAIHSYFEDPSGTNATALQSVATLLKGMLSADGITVLKSDASLVGYNVFVSHQSIRPGGIPIGGARLRSYNVLRQHVGTDLTAAFYRSQDGVAFCDSIFQAQHQHVAISDSQPPQAYQLQQQPLSAQQPDSQKPMPSLQMAAFQANLPQQNQQPPQPQTQVLPVPMTVQVQSQAQQVQPISSTPQPAVMPQPQIQQVQQVQVPAIQTQPQAQVQLSAVPQQQISVVATPIQQPVTVPIQMTTATPSIALQMTPPPPSMVATVPPQMTPVAQPFPLGGFQQQVPPPSPVIPAQMPIQSVQQPQQASLTSTAQISSAPVAQPQMAMPLQSAPLRSASEPEVTSQNLFLSSGYSNPSPASQARAVIDELCKTDPPHACTTPQQSPSSQPVAVYPPQSEANSAPSTVNAPQVATSDNSQPPIQNTQFQQPQQPQAQQVQQAQPQTQPQTVQPLAQMQMQLPMTPQTQPQQPTADVPQPMIQNQTQPMPSLPPNAAPPMGEFF